MTLCINISGFGKSTGTGTFNHSALLNLANDDHIQYPIKIGRNGETLQMRDTVGTSTTDISQSSATTMDITSNVAGSIGHVRIIPKGANAFLQIGSGSTAQGIKINGNNGSSITKKHITDTITIPAGSGSGGVVGSNTLFAGLSMITHILYRVTQAPGGGSTTFTIRDSTGAVTFIYDSSVNVHSGNNISQSGSQLIPYNSNTAQPLSIYTNNNVTGASMIVEITVYYEQITNLTS